MNYSKSIELELLNVLFQHSRPADRGEAFRVLVWSGIRATSVAFNKAIVTYE